MVILLSLSHHKKGLQKNKEKRDSVKSIWKNKGKCFGAKMKNKGEGQFIDRYVCYKCNIKPLCSSVSVSPARFGINFPKPETLTPLWTKLYGDYH